MEKVHTPPSPDDGHEKIFVKSKRNKTDLISRNEKTQIEAFICVFYKIWSMALFQALRKRYQDYASKSKSQSKLRRLKFFSYYVIPGILVGNLLFYLKYTTIHFFKGFCVIYFTIGIFHSSKLWNSRKKILIEKCLCKCPNTISFKKKLFL